MPSSTFSFDDRLPHVPWGRAWLLALGIVAILLTGWEGICRRWGFAPAVEDSVKIWAVMRGRVDGDSVVLLGSSRMQSDVDPQVLGSALGEQTPVQLAILGGSPLPVLEELAADPSFAGTVIVDFVPRLIFDATREREKRVYEHLQAYRWARTSPAEWMEIRLRLLAEDKLVFLNPALSLQRVAPSLWRGRKPEVPYFSMRPDRHTPLDFSRRDPRAYEEVLLREISRQGREPSPDERQATLARIARAAARLQGRGGRVAFVYFPVCDRVREVEEHRYPRRVYWENLGTRTGALTLHFEDFPSLARFDCPDGSHLDRRETARFSRALGQLLAPLMVSRSR